MRMPRVVIRQVLASSLMRFIRFVFVMQQLKRGRDGTCVSEAASV